MQGLLSHCFSQTEGTEVVAQNYTQETFEIRQKTVKKSDAFLVCEFHGWMGIPPITRRLSPFGLVLNFGPSVLAVT